MKAISFDIECLKCGKNLHCPQSAAGKKVKCPKCQTVMVADPSRGNVASPVIKEQPKVATVTKKTDVVTNNLKADKPIPKAEPEPPPAPVEPKKKQKKESKIILKSLTSKPVPAAWPTQQVNPNLRYCGACSGVVSVQAYKCVHCGHTLRKPQRGPVGFLLKWLFIFFNLYMIYVVFRGASVTGDSLISAESDAERAGTLIGSTIGMGMILSFWAMGSVILGILVLLTRPKTA